MQQCALACEVRRGLPQLSLSAAEPGSTGGFDRAAEPAAALNGARLRTPPRPRWIPQLTSSAAEPGGTGKFDRAAEPAAALNGAEFMPQCVLRCEVRRGPVDP